jgi:hypothetical protein
MRWDGMFEALEGRLYRSMEGHSHALGRGSLSRKALSVPVNLVPLGNAALVLDPPVTLPESYVGPVPYPGSRVRTGLPRA